MAYDPGLVERIRTGFENEPDVATKPMFGGLAFLIERRLICCVNGDELIVRLAPSDRAAALTQPHVRPMDFTARPMGGFVIVEPAGLESDAALQRWIQAAFVVARALPP